MTSPLPCLMPATPPSLALLGPWPSDTAPSFTVQWGIPPPPRHLSAGDWLGAVPAVAVNCIHGTITLHPHLYHRKAPQFVLRYLLRFACAQLHPAEANTHAFLERQRSRVAAWLHHEGFPLPDETYAPARRMAA